MALLFADGFPYVAANISSKYAVGGTGTTPSSYEVLTGGRFGGRYLKLVCTDYNRVHAFFRKTFGTTPATLMVQFGFNGAVLPTGTAPMYLVYFEDGTTEQCHLECTAAGILIVRRGDNLLGQSTLALSMQAWHQIEMKIAFSNTGTVLVKVDGVTFLDLTNPPGYDTTATTNNYANSVRFNGMHNSFTGSWTWYLSDVLIMDTAQVGGENHCNDLLGPRMVKLCSPSMAGYYTQWSPSAGSNWDCVEEIPPTESEYNSTDTVDEIDTFVVGDVAVGSTVDAVVCSIYAKNGVAGNTIRGVTRSNSVDGNGDAKPLGNSYTYAQSVIYENPDTLAPFTAAEFNAAEFGYQIRV